MARSLKKGPYVFERLLKKVQLLNESGIIVDFEKKGMGFAIAMDIIANNPEYLKSLSRAAIINSSRFNTTNFKNAWVEIFND